MTCHLACIQVGQHRCVTLLAKTTVAYLPGTLPGAFYGLLVVQFLSTLADSAFLIVAIARVVELADADWRIPLLKIAFTVFYVVLAPLVGPVSDTLPKGRVMVMANAFKATALLLLLAGTDPLWVIAIAGWGAAVYAPAKYGLMTELLRPADLVRANGFFEGATVCAVILGTVLGGLLVSPLLPVLVWPAALQWPATSPTLLTAGMSVILSLNVLATLLSVGIGDSGARYDLHSLHPIALVKRFRHENLLLWRDRRGGVSMTVTTLLWGVGATLQLIVLRWSQEVLGLSLDQSAYLQGVTAVGVVVGAMAASRTVSLARAPRVLPLGIALGLMIPLLVVVDSVVMAAGLLVLVGGMAGFFVVPMNALLQHRGYTLLTAGRSIAVQGFNENAGMLLMLAVYAVAVAWNLPLKVLILSFGILVASGMALVYGSYRRSTTVRHRL